VLHPKAVVDAGYRLVSSVSSLYSTNKITDYLKSLGHKVSKTFVGQYLEWFEDAYFLFSVQLFSASMNRRNTNPRKIYCIDHGMVQAVLPMITEDRGRLLENIVFLHLKRQGHKIFYYRTQNGREVDFIWQERTREKNLAQVCWTMKDGKTRQREISSLLIAMEEQQVEAATIITHDESEIVQEGNKKIEILPAWRFLLLQ
jgi:hypothetical protein